MFTEVKMQYDAKWGAAHVEAKLNAKSGLPGEGFTKSEVNQGWTIRDYGRAPDLTQKQE